MTYKYDPEDRLVEMTVAETLLNGEGDKREQVRIQLGGGNENVGVSFSF